MLNKLNMLKFRNIKVIAQIQLKSHQLCHKSTMVSPELKCGQPTFETHPHLMKQGEIVPCIQKQEFVSRRRRLMDAIRKFRGAENHLVVIPSAVKKYMSDKIPYVFRQNTDYLYLSGNLEPDSCLAITSRVDSDEISSVLFVRNPDSHSELWDGPRTDTSAAVSLFGVDQSLTMSELEKFLHLHIKSNKNCVVWYDYLDPIQTSVNKIMSELLYNKVFEKWESPKTFIHRLRLIKSSSEIELMKKTCQIASDAIIKTIEFSKPGVTEHQLYAKVDYECRIHGAEYLAYPPVVAGGNRATTIHYIDNNQTVHDGQMLLMDAGCEYHGYSSDITRTWPINGKFSPEQKVLYEIVHETQCELIKSLGDLPTLDALFESMCQLLGKKLQEVKLVKDGLSSEQLYKATYGFCPHHVSHYLGMDVHDTSLIPRTLRLEPGMVITVEPGIYITDKHKVPKEFQGLGVRIEDDVLITDSGPVVLTQQCPKRLSDIETLMSNSYNKVTC